VSERIIKIGISPLNEKVSRNCGMKLTPRELDVLRLLAIGHGSKQVASALGISHKTVDQYRSRVMLKTNAQSVAQLVHYAIRNQIIEIQK
jgi:DNA-binding CsgD family transcriptional regulator